jgi:ABC-type phosphate/phosphonate transport system substrate-binding protein
MIAHSVTNQSIDAGFIRTGMLEALQSDGFDVSQIKILHEQTGLIPFYRSTDVYPHWGFLVSPTISDDVKTAVQKALFALTPDNNASQSAGINGFVEPPEYRKIKDIMQALKVPPFDS